MLLHKLRQKSVLFGFVANKALVSPLKLGFELCLKFAPIVHGCVCFQG
nr:MAG TPA: hypothetical protein [Caudoviricetes sp.]